MSFEPAHKKRYVKSELSQFLTLPREVIEDKILPYLTAKELVEFAQVSKYSKVTTDFLLKKHKEIHDQIIKFTPQLQDACNNIDLDSTLSILLCAINNNFKDIVKVLLKYKININERDIQGKTPLIHAVVAQPSNIGIVKLLLEYGANVNLQDNNGKTALMNAVTLTATTSSDNIVKILINAGTNLELRDNKGNTALLLSLIYTTSTLETHRILLKYGANMDVVNINNDSYESLEWILYDESY